MFIPEFKVGEHCKVSVAISCFIISQALYTNVNFISSPLIFFPTITFLVVEVLKYEEHRVTVEQYAEYTQCYCVNRAHAGYIQHIARSWHGALHTSALRYTRYHNPRWLSVLICDGAENRTSCLKRRFQTTFEYKQCSLWKKSFLTGQICVQYDMLITSSSRIAIAPSSEEIKPSRRNSMCVTFAPCVLKFEAGLGSFQEL